VDVSEVWGVLAAMLSSALGGTAVAATRYVAGVIDPMPLASFRFGIGAALLWPLALLQRSVWPAREDWLATMGLGLLFFALFPLLFNASLAHTTAARGALSLSTLPLLTMTAAALLGVERLTARKTCGVLIAMAGVALALLSSLAVAPPRAWLGDLLMVGAALCMALYNVWSRPIIRRSSPIAFTAMAMAVGAAATTAIGALRDQFAPVPGFNLPQWTAIVYLGVFGGAITFFLWAFALKRTTPTLVAVSVTVNPVAAALLATHLLEEPIRWNLIAGLVTVLVGIVFATWPGRR
jgi:drug/metabolite transporter (DMT)-like permease